MNLSNIETWCARRGLVMKDFPDRLIAQAATTGDTGLLDAWLDELAAQHDIGAYKDRT